MKNFSNFTLLIILLTLPSLASAYRCSTGNIVKRGDTKTEVQLKCGAPLLSNYEGTIKIRNKYVYVDRWTYGNKPGSFYKILEFHDSTLKKIDNGPRVR